MTEQRAIVSLAITSVVAGCALQGLPPSEAIPRLSVTDKRANAERIATMIAQQCFDRAEDSTAFAAAVETSGWQLRRTSTRDPANPLTLDAWELPGIMLVRGQPGDGMWVCSVSVDAALAPDRAEMRRALGGITYAPTDATMDWWWDRSFNRRVHMTLDASDDGARGLFISIDTYSQPSWRGLLRHVAGS